jgi:hypothetical protein
MMMCQPSFRGFVLTSMKHPVLDFHAELSYRNAKSPASYEAGLLTIVKG